MLTITDIHHANLAAARLQAHHANLANYLANASLADLAHLSGALAAELGSTRGIPVADLYGSIQARIEAAQGAGR